MRRSWMTVVAATATTLSVSLAFGQAPRPQQKAAVPNAKEAAPTAAQNAVTMERLLEKWEERSTLLKSLEVGIKRVDRSVAWGDATFSGRAVFMSPNYAALHFDKHVADDNGKEKKVADERILCTGSEVWQYKYDVQQVFIFPLDREQRKRALEEGPLPFLFNMKKAEAEQRYLMTYHGTVENNGQSAYMISIRPRLKIDQESFSLARILLDTKFLLPTRIVLISPNGKDTKDFILNPIKPNVAVNESFFKGQPVKAPWKMVRNPAGDAEPQDPPAKDARQPALKNAARPGRR